MPPGGIGDRTAFGRLLNVLYSPDARIQYWSGWAPLRLQGRTLLEGTLHDSFLFWQRVSVVTGMVPLHYFTVHTGLE